MRIAVLGWLIAAAVLAALVAALLRYMTAMPGASHAGPPPPLPPPRAPRRPPRCPQRLRRRGADRAGGTAGRAHAAGRARAPAGRVRQRGAPLFPERRDGELRVGQACAPTGAAAARDVLAGDARLLPRRARQPAVSVSARGLLSRSRRLHRLRRRPRFARPRAQRARGLARRRAVPFTGRRRPGAGPRRDLVGPLVVPPPRLARDHDHRHGLLPLSPLPPAERYAGEARLRAPGARHARSGRDAAGAAAGSALT